MNFTVESKTYTKSPAELATQLNAQKPIEAPVAASARRRWLKARPMLLLGTASKDSSVVTRDALVLRLSYLADDITTPEGLAKKLATFAPEHLLLIDADSGLDGRLHAHLVIPLTSPLKVSLGDDELYIAAQQIWLAQLRSRKVLTQVPRLRKDEWDQHMVWPTPTQAAKPVAFYHDGPVTDMHNPMDALKAQKRRCSMSERTSLLKSCMISQTCKASGSVVQPTERLACYI